MESIPGFFEVAPGLYRGGQPSPEGLARLQQMGIKTIINLKGELYEQAPGWVRRESDWAARAGVRFEHIPLHLVRSPRAQQVDRAVALMQDANNRPLFVHCDQGINRTGFVVAAYRVKAEGWTARQAYEEMVRFGFRRRLLFWWKWLLFRYAARG